MQPGDHEVLEGGDDLDQLGDPEQPQQAQHLDYSPQLFLVEDAHHKGQVKWDDGDEVYDQPCTQVVEEDALAAEDPAATEAALLAKRGIQPHDHLDQQQAVAPHSNEEERSRADAAPHCDFDRRDEGNKERACNDQRVQPVQPAIRRRIPNRFPVLFYVLFHGLDFMHKVSLASVDDELLGCGSRRCRRCRRCRGVVARLADRCWACFLAGRSRLRAQAIEQGCHFRDAKDASRSSAAGRIFGAEVFMGS